MIGSRIPPKEQLISTLHHRGPDSSGYYQTKSLCLVHTRLAIQDLSPNANQPMENEDGRYTILFNGEIYNHWEIRKELTEFNFVSKSDTETILYGYIKFGIEIVNRLNGIFAFCIFDKVTEEIFMARDQMGVKPFYYYIDGHQFIFSSEIKSILHFDIDKSLSVSSLSSYLSLLWSPGERTPFNHVKKLLPGHYLRFKVNEFKNCVPISYYKIDFRGKYFDKSISEIVDILDERLQNAVKRQILSDVPVGFFLSGGLDSSLIVAIAKKLYPYKNFPCFTIDAKGLKDSEGFADDLHYAKIVAKYLDIDLQIIKSEFDIVKDFDKMIWHLDEPQADSAPLNVLNIAQEARKSGTKVLLGGTGGDDLFGGYRRHSALNLERYFSLVPHGIRTLIRKSLYKLPLRGANIRRMRKLTADFDKSSLERRLGYFTWISFPALLKLFNEKHRPIILMNEPTNYLKNLLKDIPEENSMLNQMLYWEMRTFLIDHNLNYTDKLAMAQGVEVRVPYLDLDLVELSTKIPPKYKVKGNETKYILKKVAERYLPKEVIYRSKTGFGGSVRHWIKNEMNDMINERLSPERIRQRGIFDEKAVWSLIEANKTDKIDASYIIWSLLAIESWMEQFVDGKNLAYP